MIKYNPKNWFTFIFRFHQSDTFRKLLPMIISISIYSALIAYWEQDYLHLADDNRIKNISIMHTLLTFVISTLLVFRTNTAYERWWEGRKLWGSLINNSRNLALKLNALLPGHAPERAFFATMISNYAFTLRSHLQNTVATGDELHNNSLFSGTQLSVHQHNPNYIAKCMFEQVQALHKSGLLANEHLLFINNELSGFTDVCGACERIKNTPIPYSYSVFLKKFIFFFVMTLPITLTFTLGYYCVPVVAFIFYVLTSLEIIAEEIEEPFGGDHNDLPLHAISKKIRSSVYEIFNYTHHH